MPRPIVALPLALAALVALAAAPARALEAADLIGTWHVLAHYKDSASDHPDRERWIDRVWRFEWEGDHLRWTDYPIVVFEDETGRFERLGTNRQSRILEFWEPSEAQLADIADGLEVNQRGAKSKTLEPTGDGGWSSEGRATPRAMNVLSYVETWSIRGLAEGRPVFERSDSLSSGMTETLEGVTRYSTESVGGGMLRGRYVRDGTEEGTFQMRPTREVAWVKGSGKTQSERFRDMAVSQYAAQAAEDPELQAQIGETFQAALVANGVHLRPEDQEALTKRVVALYAEGKSPEEVQRIIDDDLLAAARSAHYAWAPEGARHDAAARYVLPFDSAAPRQLSQGNGGRSSHQGKLRYAFDFRLPVGEPVVAARAGKVVSVVDEYDRGGPVKSLMDKANAVIVLHDDGSFASYVHLSKGAEVEEGDEVEAGDRLGRSGNTGYTTEPHLHFAVWVLDGAGEAMTVPIRFVGETAAGFVPEEGGYYGGPGWKAGHE